MGKQPGWTTPKAVWWSDPGKARAPGADSLLPPRPRESEEDTVTPAHAQKQWLEILGEQESFLVNFFPELQTA